MGAFPRVTKQVIRPIHLRGIDRCIMIMDMVDMQEIAEASGLTKAEQVEESLTQMQKMKLGKNKKKKANPSDD